MEYRRLVTYLVHGSDSLITYRWLLFYLCLPFITYEICNIGREFTQTRLTLIHGYDNKNNLRMMAATGQSEYFLDHKIN
jgi:hypothetical protein